MDRSGAEGGRCGAYLAVVGVGGRAVRLRGVPQLLLGARVPLLQRGQLARVRVHLLQRRVQRARLRRRAAGQRVQRRVQRERRARYARGERAAGRHARRVEVHLQPSPPSALEPPEG